MSYVKSDQVTNPNGITDEAAHIILEGAYKYFILAPLEETGKHVLSFWVKGKTSGEMTVNYGEFHKEVSVTAEWQRVIFKFDAKAKANIWIYFSGIEYWMYNTQLELGDIATDYSRNPKEVEEEFKQDIADTKEQVEQYRKETAAQILITQESITQSVTGLEERISKDYYTKTETNSLVSITQSSILQTVSANITETRNYADTVASAAQANAINDTTNRLKNYSTTTQMNSAIDQRTDSITSTVNKQITETKTYADTAATNAKNAAITDTTNRLKSYSTTTQMNTAIEQKANSITSTVAATYTTKTETTNAINNINVGNRNILLKTNQGDKNWSFTFQNGSYSKTSFTALGVNACKFTITTASTGYAVICYNSINRSIMSPRKTYTLEFDILPNKAVNLNAAFMQSNGVNNTGNFGAKSFAANVWGHYSGTVTFNSTAIGSQVIYITGLNASGLQVVIANLIMVEGNKCGSWNPAPEDIETTITETTTQLQSQISQTQTSILQTVSATYATNGTVDQVKSSVASVEVTANKINWLVKSGTSASNFTLTDRTATLISNYINLHGLVQFSGLDASTKATITKVSNWSSASNTTLIDGGKIYTGSITADKLKVTDLAALNAKLGGWQIDNYGIAAHDLPRREIILHKWDDPNQPFPYIFYSYDTNTASEFFIAPDHHVRISSSHSPALWVTGKCTFSGYVGAESLGVTWATALNTLSTSGKATLSSLDVNGAVNLKSTLSVSNTSTFTGKTTHNGGISTTTLTITGSEVTYLNSAKATTFSTSAKATLALLDVTGATALKSTLLVSSTSTFTGKTTHNGGIGTTTLAVTSSGNNVLTVSGTSSFSGKTTHSGGINVSSGGLTVTGGITVSSGDTTVQKLKVAGYVGFFNTAPRAKTAVGKMSTTGTPTVTALRAKLNDLIVALNNYGLV